MPKVVLYDVDGLINQGEIGGRGQLFYPEQTKATFEQHLRKKDHIIVCSFLRKAEDLIKTLVDCGIRMEDITGKIEIICGALYPDAPIGNSYENQKITKAKEEMHRRGLNAAVIVDNDISINWDEEIVHILVPSKGPNVKPVSASYLQAPLLPTSILQKQIKPAVDKIKSIPYNKEPDTNKLSNLYLRFTNLFKPPASYEKLSIEKDDYEKVISILSDYCKSQGKSSSILGMLNRFFSGHWNRHHTDAVQTVLNEASLCKDTPSSLLKKLKEKLITAGNPLNPSGSLARRIEFLQTKRGLNVIDIDDLNTKIGNKPSLCLN
jgi:Domain of unknown function (DUF5617)